ncbi:hypothetical protein EDD21DRAFT_377337 [Dissophora ornata]|nr:hypothetical protein BGZ58_005293 [Dissophora ornata]KAI8600393.1 hypothetical protein EDD21DRAFT_377337 [Dissophora ornata]
MCAASAIPDTHTSADAASNPQTPFDVSSILSSESATLDASMTKEQVLEIGQYLSQHNAHLTRLSLNESFKDLQDAIKEFLLLPCCSELQILEYKAGGSSFGQILLSLSSGSEAPVSASAATTTLLDQLKDESFVQAHVPFAKTLTTLRLGYNSDAPQAENDIAILNGLLRRMPRLQELSMAQSLDNLSLFESGLKVKKVSVTMNVDCGMEQEEVETRIRELVSGSDDGEVDLNVEMDERESSYYLNLSRDRHFQAFIRRFGGDRKQ